MRVSTQDSIWLRGWKRIWTFWWRWRDLRWLVVGGLWLVALLLGYVGFAKYTTAMGDKRSPWDLLYLALQLFTLESGAILALKPLELEVARLLAPAVVVYTIIQALVTIFYRQLQFLDLCLMRDHVIICGLGRKGFLLAKRFLAREDQVVVLDRDPDNVFFEQCKELGIIVLAGDATNPELLSKAGVHKAKYLIAVCNDDSVNAEIAVQARELMRTRKGKVLPCFVHIIDAQLRDLLRGRELEIANALSFRLEFFNIFDMGARALLSEFSPFDRIAQAPERLPHLLIVGLGRMGQSLAVYAARSWHPRYSAIGKRLLITVVDKDAKRKVDMLCLRYPQLSRVCKLNTQEMDIRWPEFQQAGFLFDAQGQCDVTAAYVCLDDDQLALTAGLALFQRLREQEIPIVVRLTHDTGLAGLLRGGVSADGASARLHAFGLLDRICRPDLLLGGINEILARATHEDYVLHQQQAGQTPATNPSMVPWDELPEHLKESNRRQADHIGVKLQTVGCGIAPLTDWSTVEVWEAESFTFSPAEVERMAEMEHERFVEERLRAGWRPGPDDPSKRISPDLVPWDQLPETVKELDRDSVRGLPVFLAKAGFQLYRLRQG